jgi:hypothetical protein
MDVMFQEEEEEVWVRLNQLLLFIHTRKQHLLYFLCIAFTLIITDYTLLTTDSVQDHDDTLTTIPR